MEAKEQRSEQIDVEAFRISEDYVQHRTLL